jgi:hypothetical protein
MPWRYTDRQRVAFYDVLCELQRLASRAHVSVADVVLMAEIAAGDTVKRPWDTTNLALHLGLPRATVAKRLEVLCRKGHIQRFPRGKRIIWLRTKRGIDYWRPRAHDVITRIVEYVHAEHR